jgi:hypothetical protein
MPMVGFSLSPVTVPSNLGSKACLNFLGSIFSASAIEIYFRYLLIPTKAFGTFSQLQALTA